MPHSPGPVLMFPSCLDPVAVKGAAAPCVHEEVATGDMHQLTR